MEVYQTICQQYGSISDNLPTIWKYIRQSANRMEEYQSANNMEMYLTSFDMAIVVTAVVSLISSLVTMGTC